MTDEERFVAMLEERAYTRQLQLEGFFDDSWLKRLCSSCGHTRGMHLATGKCLVWQVTPRDACNCRDWEINADVL